MKKYLMKYKVNMLLVVIVSLLAGMAGSYFFVYVYVHRNYYYFFAQRNFLTRISWGTITKLRCPICSKNDIGFRNLASIVPATHTLKFLFASK